MNNVQNTDQKLFTNKKRHLVFARILIPKLRNSYTPNSAA